MKKINQVSFPSSCPSDREVGEGDVRQVVGEPEVGGRTFLGMANG